MEIEMHLIDDKGSISFEAPNVIESIQNTLPEIPITKECGKNMIEFGCYPTVNTISPAIEMIESIELTNEILERSNLHFYPFATYPGKFEPQYTDSSTYKIKEKIFGEKFNLATKVTGFHHHYTLPKGVFDSTNKELRLLKQSKLKRSMINSYNFEISIDPILTTFTQSSPFFDGVNIAKDSRMVIYRGGKKLKYPNGLYGKQRLLGYLQNYSMTQTDLMTSLRKRQLRMKRLIQKVDKKADFDKIYPTKLDIGWNPVKINKHGTLEQRGMDMNLLSILFSVSTMIKYSLRKIQREFIEVIPADYGLKSSFKIDNGILYIPPFATVNNLQKRSAYDGLASKSMYEYTKRFLNFSKTIITKKYHPLLKPVNDMVDSRKTISDQVFSYAKRKGFVDDGKISQEGAKSLALYSNKLFEKDITDIKKKLEYISNL
jgi:carboxylate-amine ligase